MFTSLRRFSQNPILSPLKNHRWESKAVLNPTVWYENNIFHMLYRAISSEKIILPLGTTYYSSSIGYAKSNDGMIFKRHSTPFIKPEYAWEKLGCEDPRITKINDIYYIFYTAVSEGSDGQLHIQIAGASTKDFKHVKKYGVIKLPGSSKAASLFPEKINNRYSFLYTQFADSPQSTIFYTQIDTINDLFANKWGEIQKIPLVDPSSKTYRGPELGAAPLKTPKGWLLIYCPESYKREWFIGGVLLDLSNPQKILGTTRRALLKSKKNYELKGFTDNVAFPSGAVIVEEDVYIYYGGADSNCCLAFCKINDLLSALTSYNNT